MPDHSIVAIMIHLLQSHYCQWFTEGVLVFPKSDFRVRIWVRQAFQELLITGAYTDCQRHSSWASKLVRLGQIWLAAQFCKFNWNTHLCIVCGTSQLQQHSWIVATETTWPARRENICYLVPFRKSLLTPEISDWMIERGGDDIHIHEYTHLFLHTSMFNLETWFKTLLIILSCCGLD